MNRKILAEFKDLNNFMGTMEGLFNLLDCLILYYGKENPVYLMEMLMELNEYMNGIVNPPEL
jgi:hypothetical protein